LRQNTTHVREEEVEEGRSFKGYERQMERGNEWRKRGKDVMVMLGQRYLRQEGDKLNFGSTRRGQMVGLQRRGPAIPSANRGKSRNRLQLGKRNIIGCQPYNCSAGDYNAL
jgi:hypothetical protein